MKFLEYKVAWIDDQASKAQGFFESINNKLGRHGFQLRVDWISNEGALSGFLNSLKKDSDYDLIMVDWKLGRMVPGGQTGASVAHQIRTHSSFSSIIFYSAENPDILRGEIAKQKIDGVFCVNRAHFVDEAMDVIRATIRKFSDLTMMRGLFLAAVAEFDDAISNCAIEGYEGLPSERKDELKNEMIDGSIDYFSKQIEKVKCIDRSGDLVSIINKLRPGSKQLADCLIRVLGAAEPSVSYSRALLQFKKYESDVLVPRNDMAHLKEREEKGRRFLVRGDREWDSAKFEGLRHTLVDHHDNLNYIASSSVGELVEHLRKDVKEVGE